MEKLVGKVAIVTGASSGIGASIAETLVKNGMQVITVARRLGKMQEAAKLLENEKGCMVPYECDLTQHELIENLFLMVEEKYGGVDVLVNNAGATTDKSLLDMTTENIKFQLDLNVTALTLGTQFAIRSMRKRNINDGYIINISSILAHRIPQAATRHFYSATKFAVRAISDGFRQELREINSGIRVACISPGLVSTEFRLHGGSDPTFDQMFEEVVPMTADDIAEAVKYVLQTPPHVEVNDIILSTCLKK